MQGISEIFLIFFNFKIKQIHLERLLTQLIRKTNQEACLYLIHEYNEIDITIKEAEKLSMGVKQMISELHKMKNIIKRVNKIKKRLNK